MRVTCQKCGLNYNDIYRWTDCPHDTFPASPTAAALLREMGVPVNEPRDERPTWNTSIEPLEERPTDSKA
jgi:hypothetical protein